MSQLLDALEWNETGKVKHEDFRFGSPITARIQVGDPYTAIDSKMLPEYRVSIRYAATFFSEPENLEFMMDKVREDLCENVYGNIRKVLREAQIALYERDYDRLMLMLDKAHKETRP